MKVLLSFIRHAFHNSSMYRASFWLFMVYLILMMYSVSFVWKTLYAGSTGVSNVDITWMVTYALLGVAMETIMHPRYGPQNYMSDQVKSGTIEMDIIKPLDFQFYMFANTFGTIVVRMCLLVIPSLIIAYLFFGLQIPGYMTLIAFLVSLLLGIVISFSLNFMLGLLGMITMNIKNISWGYNAMLRFFSGQMVPLWLFPGFIGAFAKILPFRCIYSIPMSIYIGEYMGAEILSILLLQLIWAVLLILFCRIFMSYVYGKLMIQGG